MKASFWRTAAVSVLLLAGLIGLDAMQPAKARPKEGGGRVGTIVRTLHKRGLNREAAQEQTAGYYEGLLNEGNRVSLMTGLTTGAQTPKQRSTRVEPQEMNWMGKRIGQARQADRYLHRKDFLYYEPKASVNVQEYHEDNRLRLVTNSAGMSDREYSLEKPAATRRIAFVGDSVTRGMGAPFGASFESLLEERLNADHVAERGPRFELLNFAVSGYRMTQVLEVALEKVPPFHPDVYIVALSEVTGSRKWSEHLAQLVFEGIDLKYEFLKKLVQDAGVTRAESPGEVEAKLAKFRLPTLRWILSEIKARAAVEHGHLIVLLVPTVRDPEFLKEEFRGVTEIASELGVPAVDLLDTFSGIDDLTPYQVSDDNVHPSELGHRLIFKHLYDRIQADPRVRVAFMGPGAPTPAR